MSLIFDAANPDPWPAGCASVITAAVVEHRYQVRVPLQELTLNAYDVEVTLDADSSPFARASFQCEISALDARNYLQPGITWIQIDTGYVLAGDLTYKCLFYGLVERVRYANGIAAVAVTSAEAFQDYPARVLYNVSDTYTSVSQALAGMRSAGALYHGAINRSVGLDAPTAAQLAIFRSQEIREGDNVDTWIRGLGDCLGQWVRGDWRNTPQILELGGYIITPRPTSWVPLDIRGLITDVSTDFSTGNYFNVLQFTAEWVESGAVKTARRTFVSDDALVDGWPIVSKSVAVAMRPAGGALTATDPTAQAWFAKALLKPSYTHELRALWWLEPGDQITHDTVFPGATGTTTIRRITFQVDAGTMTIESIGMGG